MTKEEIKNKITQLKNEINDNRNTADAANKRIEELKLELNEMYSDKRNLWLNTLLDAIVIGVARINYSQYAPYTHGYCVTFGNGNGKRETIITKEDFYSKTELIKMYDILTQSGFTDNDFETIEKLTNDAWNNLPTSYDPNKFTPSKEYLHGNYIANGYETDGFSNIIHHRCHGTYSSYTPANQNTLAELLIAMKGFCIDAYNFKNDELEYIVAAMLKRHGIDGDIYDKEDWAKRNPTRCDSENTNFVPKIA